MTIPLGGDRAEGTKRGVTARSSTTANLSANAAGSILTSLIQFAIIPVYIRLLGAESYGLIGFQTTLQSLAQLLDFGVSASVNRELARRTALADPPNDIRDMVRTLEGGYAAIGLLLGAVVFLMAPVAERWLNHDRLSGNMVRHSMQAMALLLAAQWPLTFYQGALLGLERHVIFNTIRVASTAVTAAGAFVVLSRVSTTPLALFLWQALMALVQVAFLAVTTWRSLPHGTALPRIRRSAVTGLWRFAARVAGVTATALLLSQTDRIVASRMLPLETFGYYMLAATVANALLYTFVTPAYFSVFPRLSALVALGDAAGVRGVYRRAWGLMTVLTVPAAATVVVFAEPLLRVWTGNEVAARTSAPIARLLVSGMALNGLLLMPQSLQLAHGLAGLALIINLGLCAVALPSLLFMTRTQGAVGTALVWPLVNVLYACASLLVTSRRFNHEAGGRWMLGDIAIPASGSVIAVLVIYHFTRGWAGAFATIAAAGLAWFGSVVVLVGSSPLLRENVQYLKVRLTAQLTR
jgi:O-antigen/teichoic acid export membrane protein